MLPAVDEAFLDPAPSRFVDTIEIPLPAYVVWAELTRDKTLDWCRGLQISWLSSRPFGLGSKAFYVTSVSPPAYRRSAEDYLVEPLGPDRCRFTWTLAFELTTLGKLNAPVASLIIKRVFRDTRAHSAQLAAR